MIKRGFDIALSGFGLVVSSPLWLALAAAIKLEDGGPVFYRQQRVGEGGRRFDAMKFRSMRPDAEALTGPVQASEHDPRVTRVGRWMRVRCGLARSKQTPMGDSSPWKTCQDSRIASVCVQG